MTILYLLLNKQKYTYKYLFILRSSATKRTLKDQELQIIEYLLSGIDEGIIATGDSRIQTNYTI